MVLRRRCRTHLAGGRDQRNGDDDPEESSGGRSRMCGGRRRSGRARDGESAGAGRAGGARPRTSRHDRVRDLVTQQRGHSCRASLPGGQSESALLCCRAQTPLLLLSQARGSSCPNRQTDRRHRTSRCYRPSILSCKGPKSMMCRAWSTCTGSNRPGLTACMPLADEVVRRLALWPSEQTVPAS